MGRLPPHCSSSIPYALSRCKGIISLLFSSRYRGRMKELTCYSPRYIMGLMTRRRRNTGPVSAEDYRKPYDVDVSWMIREPCEWCGKPMTVNNYPDRKIRRKRFFNRTICAYCIHHTIDIPFLRELLQLVRDVAKVPCLQAYEGRKGKKQRKCTCLPCQARRLLREPERNKTAEG